jgi:hypothetical protein
MRRLILIASAGLGVALAVLSWRLFGRIGVDMLVGVASTAFAVLGVRSARRRSAWANTAFLTVGLLGLAKSVASYVVTAPSGTFSAGTMHAIGVMQGTTGGFVLGLIAALVMSRELLGTEEGEVSGEQGAAPNSRPPSPLPASPQIQTPDSLRAPSSGGCG